MEEQREYKTENSETTGNPSNPTSQDKFANLGSATTTGSGFSQAERELQDGSNSETDEVVHRGSEELIEKYNINDQAHSDSSLEDFIPTVSNFKHGENEDNSSGTD